MQYKIVKKEVIVIIRDVVRYGKPPKSGCIVTTISGWTIWGIQVLRKNSCRKIGEWCSHPPFSRDPLMMNESLAAAVRDKRILRTVTSV